MFVFRWEVNDVSDFHKKKAEKKAEITYNLTNAQIAALESEAYAKGVAKGVIEGIHCSVGAMCKVLHISYGWGRGRIPDLCDRVLGMLSHAGGPNVLSIDEMKQAAYDWGNIKDIEFKRRK